MGSKVHEWSPLFRDLIFDIASFVKQQNSPDRLALARHFRSHHHQREILWSLSDEELSLLILKLEDYQLIAPASARKEA